MSRASSSDVHITVQVERWKSSHEGVRAFSAHDGKVCLQMWTYCDTTTAYLTAEKVDELIEALKHQKKIAAANEVFESGTPIFAMPDKAT